MTASPHIQHVLYGRSGGGVMTLRPSAGQMPRAGPSGNEKTCGVQHLW